MPVRVGSAGLAVRKRWRHRKAVLTATPQRSAEATTVSPSLSDRPNSSQRSFFRNPASGAPVSALKLLPHFLQRNRRTPFAAPQPTAAPSPQCGHRRSSPRLPSIAAVTAARRSPRQHLLKLKALISRQVVNLRKPRPKGPVLHENLHQNAANSNRFGPYLANAN